MQALSNLLSPRRKPTKKAAPVSVAAEDAQKEQPRGAAGALSLETVVLHRGRDERLPNLLPPRPTEPAEEVDAAERDELPSSLHSSMCSSLTSPPKRVRFDKDAVDRKTFRWSRSRETFTLANSEDAEDAGATAPDLVAVLLDRLYMARHADVRLSDYFSEGVQTRIVKPDRKFVYRPFCADFGPINLGMTHRFCEMMSKLLQETPPNVRVVYCAGAAESAEDNTNAVYLLGAFLLLHLGATVDQASKPRIWLLRLQRCARPRGRPCSFCTSHPLTSLSPAELSAGLGTVCASGVFTFPSRTGASALLGNPQLYLARDHRRQEASTRL